MPSGAPLTVDFTDASPYTPQKAATNSPTPGSQPNNSKSKSRSANKPRPKQDPMSPKQAKPGRTTPPQSAASKAATAAAFAGATFHASPAPSSLPIPSFLAKALDSPGLKESDGANQEPSPPATDSEAPTPKHRPLTTAIAREESPLDVFFRADRAEKEQARRGSSANVLAVNPGPFSPPVQSKSPQQPKTLPSGFGSHHRRQSAQRNSMVGISSSELDGTPGRPMGPAFSTPYQDRIRAARSSEKQGDAAHKATATAQQQQQQQVNDDLSERLKKFLAVPMSPAQSQPNQAAALGSPVRDCSVPVLKQTFAGPTMSHGVDGGRPPEILHMEDSLRRILKIGPGLNPGPTASTSYQSS